MGTTGGTYSARIFRPVMLRKDRCDNLAYAILTRASTKARMLTWISPEQHQF